MLSRLIALRMTKSCRIQAARATSLSLPLEFRRFRQTEGGGDRTNALDLANARAMVCSSRMRRVTYCSRYEVGQRAIAPLLLEKY